MERDNAEEVRLTYILEAIFGEQFTGIYGGDGRFVVTLDHKYHDVGRAQGEALVEAGYVLIGAHPTHGENDRIDQYTIASLDRLERDSEEGDLTYYGDAR